MTGSQDLFAARWDGGLPGGLAAGRRPAFSVNALEPPLSCDLLTVAGAAEDPERAETVARSLLLAMLVAQVGVHVTFTHMRSVLIDYARFGVRFWSLAVFSTIWLLYQSAFCA